MQVTVEASFTVYVIVYIPDGAEPEVFGPFSTSRHAINLMRALASAGGQELQAPPSGLMASVDLVIDGVRNRYQLLQVGSPEQLEVHVAVIGEIRESTPISVDSDGDLSPPGRFSSY